ncbi:MAG: hypothetical protein KY476_00925 [Planctomycetes bacterium]|nr:hypothetical protein [Planctomycetota bacterium]
MPISRFPRPGYAVAPRTLRGLLSRRVPIGGKRRFRDLDAGIWRRLDPETVFRLAEALVREVTQQQSLLKEDLADTLVPLPQRAIALESLELEARTFHLLANRGIQEVRAGLSGCRVAELLEFPGMGIKSLVDLLTSLEPHAEDPDFVVPRSAHPSIPPQVFDLLGNGGRLPAWSLGCVLPRPQAKLPLSDFDLSERTHGALARAGFDRHPERLAELTIGEVLQIRGFGVECLSDLLGSLSSMGKAASDGLRVELPADSIVELDELKRAVAVTPRLPQWLLNRRLPSPAGARTLRDLQLRNRTAKALRKAGFYRCPDALGTLTVGRVISFRSFGVRSLFDLLERIHAWNKRDPLEEQTPQLPVPRDLAQWSNSEIPTELRRCALPAIPEGAVLADLRLPWRAHRPLEEAGFGRTPQRLSHLLVGELLRLKGIGTYVLRAVVEAIYRLHETGIDEAREPSFDSAVLDCLVPNRDRRDQEIVARRLGLCGYAPETLASVSVRFGITRERVRQICAERRSELRRWLRSHSSNAVVDRLRRLAPCSLSDASQVLQNEGLLERSTNLRCVLKVFDHGGRKTGLVIRGGDDCAMLLKSRCGPGRPIAGEG